MCGMLCLSYHLNVDCTACHMQTASLCGGLGKQLERIVQDVKGIVVDCTALWPGKCMVPIHQLVSTETMTEPPSRA